MKHDKNKLKPGFQCIQSRHWYKTFSKRLDSTLETLPGD